MPAYPAGGAHFLQGSPLMRSFILRAFFLFPLFFFSYVCGVYSVGMYVGAYVCRGPGLIPRIFFGWSSILFFKVGVSQLNLELTDVNGLFASHWNEPLSLLFLSLGLPAVCYTLWHLCGFWGPKPWSFCLCGKSSNHYTLSPLPYCILLSLCL